MKIGFISKNNPLNKKAWSGTIHQLYKNIQTIENVEVIWVPVNGFYAVDFLVRNIMKILCMVFKKKYSMHLNIISKLNAKSINKELINQTDILFSPAGSTDIAFLNTDKPIIYLSDTTFKSIYNYYPTFSDFFGFNKKQGNIIEKNAAEKASKIIVSSDWAKNSFVNDYNIPECKIKVLEFGANIDDIQANIQNTNNNILSLLFLAVEWERKGGDIVMECVDYLKKQGYDIVLNIVGCSIPSQYKSQEYIIEHGFLNKNIKEQYDTLKQIMYSSDILLLPTRAECSAIAFAEASAYSLPILTTDTGGISNYVINGVNGYRLSLSCKGIDFAEKIISIIENNELLNLKKGCQQVFKDRLNWNKWTSEFKKIVIEIHNK